MSKREKIFPIRLSEDDLLAIERLVRLEQDLPSRAEMLRRLVQRADAVAARRESRESAK